MATKKENASFVDKSNIDEYDYGENRYFFKINDKK